ncbi:hypothetical protein GN244_ATG11831 [Phytophthora infestans]|uniref:Uncharacterized protein n=1 Tax=Phytophthora infestans TaxID=4787 RepID=A0A833WB50_PHYIN|nr:hypothetical protein GN244_ATG11831 [Phytophthora infestans]
MVFLSKTRSRGQWRQHLHVASLGWIVIRVELLYAAERPTLVFVSRTGGYRRKIDQSDQTAHELTEDIT